MEAPALDPSLVSSVTTLNRFSQSGRYNRTRAKAQTGFNLSYCGSIEIREKTNSWMLRGANKQPSIKKPISRFTRGLGK